jgi:hypothetical protein
VASYAVVLCSRPSSLDGILIILDQRVDADEIMIEMRAKGHDVEVRELRDDCRLVDPLVRG